MEVENITANVKLKKKQRAFRLFRLMIPLIIGITVTSILFYQEFNWEAWNQFRFTWVEGACVILAFHFMIGKDLGMMWRFRLMCGPEKLSWQQAFHTNLFCEFTSAITPSAVGGSGLIVLLLKAEGIPTGKGTAVMISTLFLDELCLTAVYPLLFLLFPEEKLFGESVGITGLRIIFAAVYILIIVWTIILYITLFRHPQIMGKIICRLFRFPLLKRWAVKAKEFSEDLMLSSKQMVDYSPACWAKAGIATLLAWSSRFLVACALFLPFIPLGDQPLVFARQFILWIVMTISPTPGGSGLGEYMFSNYYTDLPGTVGMILLITCGWRILTFYLYLLAGACFLPSWIRNKFHSND